MPNQQPNLSAKLRFDFVGMIFALAIGQVAREVCNFYMEGYSLFDYPYVGTHLFLATYIIASSWIGWKNSESDGNKEPVEDTFSLSFLVLLMDLFLVICYFIIASEVDKPAKGIQPDSQSEVFWSLVIFITYFTWDIVTKLWMKLPKGVGKGGEPLKERFYKFCKRGYPSLLCSMIVLAMYCFPQTNITHAQGNTITADLILILTFILFRGLKLSFTFNHKEQQNRIVSIRIIGVLFPSIIIVILFFVKYLFYV